MVPCVGSKGCLRSDATQWLTVTQWRRPADVQPFVIPCRSDGAELNFSLLASLSGDYSILKILEHILVNITGLSGRAADGKLDITARAATCN